MEKLLGRIRRLAKQHPKRIVFPESTEPRTLQAIRKIVEAGYAHPVLIGKERTIKSALRKNSIPLKSASIQDPAASSASRQYSTAYYQLRKGKGMSKEEAQQRMLDPVYYGTMMVRRGDADGLIYGAVHPTADTFHPALQMLREQGKRVSSFFLMKHNKEFYFFADAAINITPSVAELADIAIVTADSAKNLLGLEKPRVAMLSFSTHGSTKHPLAEKVRQAAMLAKRKRPDLIIDGELQADAALLPEVYKIKCKHPVLKKPANILIFPDLEAANIAYKLVEWLGHYQAVGPIAQGLRKPVNDLSRGCTVQDIVDVTAITVVQAQAAAKKRRR